MMMQDYTSSSFQALELHILQYTNIGEPLIRSLWSLEAAHANASDVFIFWLAAGATLKSLFDQPKIRFGITSEVAQQITALFNVRYRQFFDNDFYFAAFILDPREYDLLVFILSDT